MKVLNEDVLDFQKAKQNKRSKDFISNTKHKVDTAFDNQERIEAEVSKKIKELNKEIMGSFHLPAGTPIPISFGQYGENPMIDTLYYELPSYYDGNISDEEKVAMKAAAPSVDVILDIIERYKKALRGLVELSRQAPSPQYPDRMISKEIFRVENMENSFIRLKREIK